MDEERETAIVQLDCIARQIRSWLDWHEKHRDEQLLITDRETHIMGLPVPFWPTHGQFENWIKAMDNAAQLIRKGHS